MKTEFLTAWNDSQLKTAQMAIKNFIYSRFFETLHTPEKNPFGGGAKTYKRVEEVLGLVYSSTSKYAGLWACSGNDLYLDCSKKFKLKGFVMESCGFVYAIWSDENETELITPIN